MQRMLLLELINNKQQGNAEHKEPFTQAERNRTMTRPESKNMRQNIKTKLMRVNN